MISHASGARRILVALLTLAAVLAGLTSTAAAHRPASHKSKAANCRSHTAKWRARKARRAHRAHRAHRATKARRAHRAHRALAGRCRAATSVVLPAPTNVHAHAGTQSIQLSWSPLRQRGIHYRVERLVSSGWRWAAATTTASQSFTGLTAGQAYSQRVIAVDKYGRRGAPSVAVSATPTPPPPPPPPPPPSGSGSGSQSWTCGWGSFSATNEPTGCWRPFSDSAWLNTPLPANPRLAQNGVDGENGDSAALVNALMSHGSGAVRDLTPIMSQDYQHALYFSSPSDPVYTLSCAHSTRNCNQQNSAQNQQVRIPCGATVPNGTDRQIVVIDQQAGYEYDLGGTISGEVLCGGGTFYVTLATKIPLNGDGRASCGADAACVGGSAGQVRAAELQAGTINHAIFVVNGDCDNTGSPASVYPALSYNSCSGNFPGAPKVGQWYYLALSDAQIAATGFPQWQQTILRALAHYGMFVGDQGSNGAFDIFTESQNTYASFNQPNPWVGYARQLASDPTNNVSVDSSGVPDFGMGNIPHSFWTQNLRAVSPCVIQATC